MINTNQALERSHSKQLQGSSILTIKKSERVLAVHNSIWLRRFSDAQFILDTDKIDALSISTEEVLTKLGIHPSDYGRVYEYALMMYNSVEAKGPFNLDTIIRAVSAMKEQTGRVDYTGYRAPVVSCKTCKDTGLEVKGILPKITYNKEGIKTYERCKQCS